MKTLRLKSVAALVVGLSASFAAGCTSTSTTPNDGRYQTRGGGWDNFRAEAPVANAAGRPS